MQVKTEIKTEHYVIQYDDAQDSVALKGMFRLTGTPSGPESYAGLLNVLNEAASANPPRLTIDMRELEFLNSSGINAMCKFVMSMRTRTGVKVIVLGTPDYAWQSKSLVNLKKLLPSLELVL